MRKRKLGDDAFAFYVSCGAGRTYQDVATKFGVVRRTVVSTAKRENWNERLEKIERDAQANADLKLQETVEAMKLRHARMLRAMAARAAKGLAEFPLTDGMQAMKAAEIVIKLERLAAGEPSERTAVDIQKELLQDEKSLVVSPSKAEHEWDEVHAPAEGAQ
jgi:hypothetical protein